MRADDHSPRLAGVQFDPDSGKISPPNPTGPPHPHHTARAEFGQEFAEVRNTATAALLNARNSAGHWTGELSTSALSTATAIMALEQLRRERPEFHDKLTPLITRGLDWLAAHQNPDGGWGDTVQSFSNIATTMLCDASIRAVAASRDELDSGSASGGRKPPVLFGTIDGRPIVSLSPAKSDYFRGDNFGGEGRGEGPNQSSHTGAGVSNSSYAAILTRSKAWIDAAGGVPALKKRYGKDKTFSVPILTHCALGGVVPWTEVLPLPFELGCLPHRFFQWISLPVVSYALPALIAIGQLAHAKRPSRNPVIRAIRDRAKNRTLNLLTSIQPTSGGFLEAAPLTSFVTMSLAGMGLARHPVAEKGLEFLLNSVREDGSWPIDTNLATWVTTLSINALDHESISPDAAAKILRWLLDQQYREIHPYTQAAPGGWAWTDLSGGVPDADDTPGAILAVIKLARRLSPNDRLRAEVPQSLKAACKWLLDLQNRDGGWPTFCRGWGALPFDRSSNDLTAHAIRALHAAREFDPTVADQNRVTAAINRGLRFLKRNQSPDGAWRPLWFGNQHAEGDENPVYGTARVLMMARDLNSPGNLDVPRAVRWLAGVQNADGGFGGAPGCPSSIEETALATEALLPWPDLAGQAADRGLSYLARSVRDGTFQHPSPIGFYFAKLWYFEQLYPMIFTTSALTRATSSATKA